MRGRSSRIAFRLECQDELTICGSADHMTQLLRILLDNAIAYTPAGGQVSVSLNRERDDAVLCVSDTGIGIDSDDLPHIFDRFYRGRAARRLRGDGVGLGLAIAAWIVSEHDGQIAVSSELGQGSCFSVRLPVV
jgi:signal transduction histidine kinase